MWAFYVSVVIGSNLQSFNFSLSIHHCKTPGVEVLRLLHTHGGEETTFDTLCKLSIYTFTKLNRLHLPWSYTSFFLYIDS